MIHHTKLFVRRLAYLPWLLTAGLVLGWTGEAAAQEVTMSVFDGSATEGEPVSFTVTLSSLVDEEVTVDYSVRVGTDDTARLVSDFAAVAPTTLTIDANTSSETFTIATTADELDEDTETFTIVLSNASDNVTLVDGVATGYIVDNDDEPTLTLTGGVPAGRGWRGDVHGGVCRPEYYYWEWSDGDGELRGLGWG